MKIAHQGQRQFVAQFHTVGELKACPVVTGVIGVAFNGVEASVGIGRFGFGRFGGFYSCIQQFLPLCGGVFLPSVVFIPCYLKFVVLINGIAGRAACGIGFGIGARCPKRGIEIYPTAALGLPRIVDIVGTLFYPCLRPFGNFVEDGRIPTDGADNARRHDFAERGIGMAQTEFERLAVRQTEGGFTYP